MSTLVVTYTGRLAPANRISARTLAHTLGHLQRAVDKLVIYESRGSIRKYAALSAHQYQTADLLVASLELGSVRIPLLNQGVAELGKKLREVLDAPYRKAAEDQRAVTTPITEQIAAARNRAVHGIGAALTQDELVKQAGVRERDWYQTAVLQEFNSLLSPLRSSRITDEETISIEMPDAPVPRQYAFDKKTSIAFNSLVTEKRLGPEVRFDGILEGLGRSDVGKFPYTGKFKSAVTGKQMKLLVPSEGAALALSPYNLKREPIAIWAAR
jgi:hypothetical protein